MPKVPNARLRTTGKGVERIQVSFYAHGKRYQPWAPTGMTLTQAKRWAQAEQYRLLSEGERLGAGTGPTSRNGSGTPGPGRGVPAKHSRTVAEVCAEWLRWYKPRCRAKNTMKRYVKDVGYIVAQIGDKDIGTLTSADISEAVTRMLEGTLSPSVVGQAVRKFQTICFWAMEEEREYLTRNPVKKVLDEWKGKLVSATDYVPMTTQEGLRLGSVFLSHVRVDDPACPYAGMLCATLATGLRCVSEWGGAQWQDIDWERGTFTLQRSWDATHGEITRRSNGKLHKRLIQLQPHVLDVLRAVWDWQHALLKWEADPEYLEPRATDFIFADGEGDPLARSTLALWLDRFMREARILREAGQHVTPHSLRHQAAIEALRTPGISPKAVRDMLGHSAIGMTVDRYASFIPGMEDTATAAVGAALFPQKKWEKETV